MISSGKVQWGMPHRAEAPEQGAAWVMSRITIIGDDVVWGTPDVFQISYGFPLLLKTEVHGASICLSISFANGTAYMPAK